MSPWELPDLNVTPLRPRGTSNGHNQQPDWAMREPPDEPPPDEQRRSTWAPIDLTTIVNGTYQAPQPTIGRRDDGAHLFYPGRVHSIASEPEAGKSWLAAAVVVDVLATGGTAVYVDFEDDEGGICTRLLALGAPPDALLNRFAYIRPEEPLHALNNKAEFGQALEDLRPSFVVIDGVTEAMSLHGLDLRDNKDAAAFGNLIPNAISRRGPAVACLDHVVKSTEGGGRWAIGAQHKLAGLNGAAYLLENKQPFGIGLTGRSTIRIAKDRPGQLRRCGLPGSNGLYWYADLVVASRVDTNITTVDIPVPNPEAVDSFRPTTLMSRVSAGLARAGGGPLSKNEIEDRVMGNAADIRRALAALVDDGYVEVSEGARGAKLHTLVKPYADGDEDDDA